jgi:hypothetical protein
VNLAVVLGGVFSHPLFFSLHLWALDSAAAATISESAVLGVFIRGIGADHAPRIHRELKTPGGPLDWNKGYPDLRLDIHNAHRKAAWTSVHRFTRMQSTLMTERGETAQNSHASSSSSTGIDVKEDDWRPSKRLYVIFLTMCVVSLYPLLSLFPAALTSVDHAGRSTGCNIDLSCTPHHRQKAAWNGDRGLLGRYLVSAVLHGVPTKLCIFLEYLRQKTLDPAGLAVFHCWFDRCGRRR